MTSPSRLESDVYDSVTRSMVNVRNMLRGAEASLQELPDSLIENGAARGIGTVIHLINRADTGCVEVMRSLHNQFPSGVGTEEDVGG